MYSTGWMLIAAFQCHSARFNDKLLEILLTFITPFPIRRPFPAA